VLILFDGGLNTSAAALKRYAAPAGVLATAGVVGTAALTGVAAHVLGFAWRPALLLGAIVSSTDAAAVFAVLRGSGIQLKRRVGVTLEAESGVNDPVAVFLTTTLIAPHATAGHLGGEMLAQFGGGLVVGLAVGFGGGWLLRRIRLPASGLYPVLTLSLACVAFGAATLAHVLRVHDSLGWLSQVGMFLVLGAIGVSIAIGQRIADRFSSGIDAGVHRAVRDRGGVPGAISLSGA
jgi:cell volume regulation protein A